LDVSFIFEAMNVVVNRLCHFGDHQSGKGKSASVAVSDPDLIALLTDLDPVGSDEAWDDRELATVVGHAVDIRFRDLKFFMSFQKPPWISVDVR